MTLSYVPPEFVAQVLGTLAKQVKKAFSVGQADAATPQELYQALESGDQIMLAVDDGERVKAAVTLGTLNYSTGRKVWVSMLAGEDMPEWADEVEDALERFREETGSMCVEASCRPGLSRFLRKRGWKVKAVIMEAPK